MGVQAVFNGLRKVWKYADQCSLFSRTGELKPTNQTWAEFGVLDGDRITAVIVPIDYINEYFKVMKTLFEEDFRWAMEQAPKAAISEVYDNGDLEMYLARITDQDICKKKFLPLMERIFIQFDTHRDGHLEEEECSEFFGSFFHKWLDFAEWATDLITEIVSEAIEAGALDSEEAMDRAAQMAKKAYERKLKSTIERMPHDMNWYIEKQRKEYETYMITWNATAFRMLDPNGDQQLSKNEFAVAMMPDSPGHTVFRESMRLRTFPQFWQHVLHPEG